MPWLAKLLRALDRTSRGWALCVAVCSGVAAGVLIGPSALPFSVQGIRNVSGGNEPLDVMWAYSTGEGVDALQALESVGRQHYGYFLIADVVFVVAYVVAMSSWLFALLGRGRWAAVLAAVPAIAGLFDLVEDVGEAIALLTYPDSPHIALVVSSATGVVKHVGFRGALLLLAVGLLVRLVGLLPRLLQFLRRRASDGTT